MFCPPLAIRALQSQLIAHFRFSSAAPDPACPSPSPPLQGKRCLVSGAGNVALFCAELLLQKGATVLSLSDSQGYIYERDGLTRAQLDQM